jgi:hypothetical protein
MIISGTRSPFLIARFVGRAGTGSASGERAVGYLDEQQDIRGFGDLH